MGIYTQAANFWSSLPIVEARNESGREDKEREVYEARFRGEYLRTSHFAEPGGERVVESEIMMRAFAEIDEAAKDRSYGKRVFGFGCEEIDRLVGDYRASLS
jgi:hypothetical protein